MKRAVQSTNVEMGSLRRAQTIVKLETENVGTQIGGASASRLNSRDRILGVETR